MSEAPLWVVCSRMVVAKQGKIEVCRCRAFEDERCRVRGRSIGCDFAGFIVEKPYSRRRLTSGQ